MTQILRSFVFGYQFDPKGNAPNPYLELDPSQKAVVDAQILRQVHRRFPYDLRRSWMNGRATDLYAKASDGRVEVRRLLAQVEEGAPLVIDETEPNTITPICRYTIIQGAHRMGYSYALSEMVQGQPRPLRFEADYETGGANPTTKTLQARCYATLSWEHVIERAHYSDRQLIELLLERLERLERGQEEEHGNGRATAALERLFHPGIELGEPPHEALGAGL